LEEVKINLRDKLLLLLSNNNNNNNKKASKQANSSQREGNEEAHKQHIYFSLTTAKLLA